MDQSEITFTTTKLSQHSGISSGPTATLRLNAVTGNSNFSHISFDMCLSTPLLKAATKFFRACLTLISKHGAISVSSNSSGMNPIPLHPVERHKEHTQPQVSDTETDG